MDQVQSERLSRVFTNLNSLQDTMDSEKANKWRQILGILEGLERKIDENYLVKQQKFDYLTDKVKQIMDVLQNQRHTQEKFDIGLEEEIQETQRNCQGQIRKLVHIREDSDQKVLMRLAHQIDLLSREITNQQSQDTQLQTYLKTLNENEVPIFIEEIKQESQNRCEIEEKVSRQFFDQINELKDTFEMERRSRETREEEIIVILKAIYAKIQKAVLKARQDRELNEEMLIQLIENVISKVKKELIESDGI